jgi:hypothetical protein
MAVLPEVFRLGDDDQLNLLRPQVGPETETQCRSQSGNVPGGLSPLAD